MPAGRAHSLTGETDPGPDLCEPLLDRLVVAMLPVLLPWRQDQTLNNRSPLNLRLTGGMQRTFRLMHETGGANSVAGLHLARLATPNAVQGQEPYQLPGSPCVLIGDCGLCAF